MTPAAQHSSVPPQGQQLLEQMHDIIAPAPVVWWPPAIGWWLMMILVLAALFAAILIVRRRRTRDAYRAAALTLIEDLRDCPEPRLATEANRLLKRVALTAFPAEQLAINQAFGQPWVDWLNNQCRQPVFAGAVATALAQGGYQPDIACPRDELLSSLRRWLREHRRNGAASRRSARV